MSLVFNTGLRFYRNTFKHIRPVHRGIHWGASHLLIPALEAACRFKTMPDDPLWFRLELLNGRHERDTRAQVARLLHPGMTVLDIGAHVGYYSRQAAHLVGESGRVLAFEPHPRTFQVLTENVGMYTNVTPLQIAAAESEGSAELYDYLMMSASGSLHYDESLRELQKAHVSADDVAPRIADDFPVRKYVVRTATVDGLLDEAGIDRVDVVKMDIEGAEMSALRGMAGTIAHSPGMALIVEYNPAAQGGSAEEAAGMIDAVLALGFHRVQAIETDGTLADWTGQADVIAHRTDALMAHMDVVNLLFTR